MGNLQILRELDKIGRICEFARIFGIEFYHVLHYGSQYRVESILLRMTKRLNYICPSPSMRQRVQQRAPEMIPLNLEPESEIHFDGPVIVLDFQSLYPSIAIAYNYCYSTCLGRIQDLINMQEFKFGCLTYEPDRNVLMKYRDQITISPSGIVFLKHTAQMSLLREIWYNLLTTRLMVKNSMKLHKDKKPLYRLLNSRQIGLKLLANVIYGYTGASYSGRMPSVEVADAIVGKGRETLSETIKLVNANQFIDKQIDKERLSSGLPARVIYGDTDSIFVKLSKCSKEIAFEIADCIAKKINLINPDPVKIKVEKVYYPCVLESKKRYAGYAYETPDQTEPILESKGVETVRRDNAPLASTALNEVFHMIFKHFNWSDITTTNRKESLQVLEKKMKLFLHQKISDISNRRIPFHEFLLSRPYRGIEGYQPGAAAPALQVARRLLSVDINAEPCRGYRVRYFIAPDNANQTLIACVRAEQEAYHYLINNTKEGTRERRNIGPTLNIAYYVMKQLLPPLERCLSLIHFNLTSWITTVPLYNIRVNRILQKRRQPSGCNIPSSQGLQNSPSIGGKFNFQLSINQSFMGDCNSSPSSISSKPSKFNRRNIMANFIQKAKAAEKCIKCHQFTRNPDPSMANMNIPFIICSSCQRKIDDIEQDLQSQIICLGEQVSTIGKRLERYERVCGACLTLPNSSPSSSHCAGRLAWLCSNFDCPIFSHRQTAMTELVCAMDNAKYEKIITTGQDSW